MPAMIRRLAIAALVAMGARVLAAQGGFESVGPQNRGFVGTIGLGTGSGITEIDGDFGAGGAPGSARFSAAAVTYDLFLGAALSGQWRVGGEISLIGAGKSFTYGSQLGTAGTTIYYSVAAAYYPFERAGVWVKANAGYGHIAYYAPLLVNGVPSGGRVPLSAGGAAAGLGLGYDWRPGDEGFLIVGFANYMTLLSMVPLEGDARSWTCRPSLLQIGIAFGYNP